MKYLSLFSGIGSPEKALTNLGIDYKLVGFSEVDVEAIKSYCAVHNVSKDLNLGDVRLIDPHSLPKDIDLVTHGSPCQDFSGEGLRLGGDEGSETKSSLMWNTVEIIKRCKPKYIIWENVRKVSAKSNVHNFNKYLSELDKANYNNYYELLNSDEYNVPQNRRRLFVVSIRKDIDDKTFSFPDKQELKVKLLDVLEKDVKGYGLSGSKIHDKIVVGVNEETGNPLLRNATKQGFVEVNKGDGIDFNYPTSKTRRGRIMSQRSHTLTTIKNFGTYVDGELRFFTSKESWRLMGFSDEDHAKAKASGVPDKYLYKQAGNSIVVNVMEEIFKKLLKIH